MDHGLIVVDDDDINQARRLAEIIDLTAWRLLRSQLVAGKGWLPASLLAATLSDSRTAELIQSTHSDQSQSLRSSRRGVLRPDQMFALVNLGLADEVADSESLLALEDDWDGEGSPGYSAETWQRGVALLLEIASHLRDVHHLRLSEAEVMPGSYGNIDIELRLPDRMLIFSVPADQDLPVRYYGHDASRRNTTKGLLDLGAGSQWLSGWLAGE